MKIYKKVLLILLAGVLTLSVAAPCVAAAVSSEKEKVIYINLKADGTPDEIYAVNIFAKGDVIDYGNYSSVSMLNTDDQILQDGNTITFVASADRTYYQGKMQTMLIPWNISISYYMDGKQYSADEIAGKSGKLEIRFKVIKNAAYDGNFYDNYALQADFTLDSNKCSNIVASDATIVNVGGDKHLSYTILPSKGIETTITADVTDFEMDAVAINGVALYMDVEIDETELKDKINEFIDAAVDLDQGAKSLNDGTKELYNATGTLNGKVGELNEGVESITSGTEDLYNGLSAISAKNDQLLSAAWASYEGLCSAGEKVLNAQLSANGFETVSLTPNTYSAVLQDVLRQLDAEDVYNRAYQAALQAVSEQVEQQADALYSGYIQANADSIYLSYVTAQSDSLYAQVAAQAILEQLVSDGTMNQQQAQAYIQSSEGQAMVEQTVANMSDEQKIQIINGAVSQLSDSQKQQILQGALASLSDEQKTQIKNAYIAQKMLSDEVTSQITEATAQAGEAAGQVAELKGQLDSYGAFYKGLKEYTDFVANASDGAGKLKLNMDTLYINTNQLKVSVGQLNDAVKELYTKTGEMKNGTGEFADKTADMNTQVDEKIDSMLDSLMGDKTEITSFVSKENTNVDSVQFVIQTKAIKIAKTTTENTSTSEQLTFWQKLLRLFGQY